MGTAAASAGAAGPRDYGPGGAAGRLKQEYTAASGRHDHEAFGSGPTRQSDDRDSEPDYLLGPTSKQLDCQLPRLFTQAPVYAVADRSGHLILLQCG